VPAAAVIREGLALLEIIGRKVRKKWLFKLLAKISSINLVFVIVLISLSLEKDNRTFYGAMKCYDIKENTKSEGNYLVQN
jgi:hypothetical protein